MDQQGESAAGSGVSRRPRPVWGRWRRDEPDIQGKGPGRSRYRAVEQSGQPMDFVLTAQRDTEAALRLLKPACHRHGIPETSTLAGSDAKAAASKSSHAEPSTHIALRQVTDVHHSVAQDQRGRKRITRPR